MSPRGRLRQVAHRLRVRDLVDRGIDRARLAIDGTVGAYQPQDLVDPRRRGARDAASRARWSQMEPVIRDVGAASGLDVGCNVGWFVAQLASLGMPVVGVEGRAATYRSAIYARDRSGLDRVGVLAMNVTPGTVEVLPSADCVLLLSVWHHMIDDNGFEAARQMLSSIWSRTTKVLFFENGEHDFVGRSDIVADDAGRTSWLAEVLGATCLGGEVRHLGRHSAGDSDRDLFAVVRVGDGLSRS